MTDVLGTLFTSKARVAILSLLFLNEGERFYLREISRRLGLNVSQVKRELVRLSGMGLLRRINVGNIQTYAIERDFILHDELASMVRKSQGIERVLGQELLKVRGISTAFIFGSYAQGKTTPKSDVDVMVIGEPDMDRLNRAVNAAEKKIKRPIQYIVYPLKEFKEKQGYGFVKNVMGKKRIFLKGDEHELG